MRFHRKALMLSSLALVISLAFLALVLVPTLYPQGEGLPQIAGKVFLGRDGVGGEGVLPLPLAYEGWVERAVAAHAPFTGLLTKCQRHPILYVTEPTVCPAGS